MATILSLVKFLLTAAAGLAAVLSAAIWMDNRDELSGWYRDKLDLSSEEKSAWSDLVTRL